MRTAKRPWFALAVLIALAAGVGPSFGFAPMAGDTPFGGKGSAAQSPAPAAAAASRLEAFNALPGVDAIWDPVLGVPALVKADSLPAAVAVGSPARKSLAAAGGEGVEAIATMTALAGVYGIKDPPAELQVQGASVTAAGWRHVRLKQLVDGIPVQGGSLRVHFDAAGRARSVNGRYLPDLVVDTEPRFLAEEAEAVARKDIAAMGRAAGALIEAPSLMIWTLNGPPTLCWTLLIDGHDPVHGPAVWRYWIDARLGAVVMRINDLRAIGPPTANGAHVTVQGSRLVREGGGVTDFSAWRENPSTYYFWNKTNLWWIYNEGDGDGMGAPDAGTYCHRFVSDWGTSDRAGISGAKAFDDIQRYWKSVHGRSSYDGAGSMAKVYIHAGYWDNAYYQPGAETFTFFDGQSVSAPLTVLDVAAHEFQHGVTEHSVDLTYANEPGAVTESWSDIFGALVEFSSQPDGRTAYPGRVPGAADWLMGEDCWLIATALRDMRNPRSTVTLASGDQQPSRYKGSYWYFGAGDNGGVHYNNGVMNFFFYLLCEGGTGNNDGIPYNLAGIGINNGGKLAYLTLSQYLPDEADYPTTRAAWIAAAQEADETSLVTVPSMAICLAAWAACGIGSADLVTPAYAFVSSGAVGGPFSPASATYRIINPSGASVTWEVQHAEPWLIVPTDPIVLSPGAYTNVTLSIDQAAAAAMPEGTYEDPVHFTNLTTAVGSTVRKAILRAGIGYKVRSTSFDWIDPVLGGHASLGFASGVSGSVAIPFDFSMFGISYNSLFVSRKGLVGFVHGSELGLGQNVALGVPDAPNAIICPMWDDLVGGSGVFVGTVGTAPDRKLVITWMNMAHADDPAARFSFQVLLHESDQPDGDIQFQYLTVAQDSPVGAGRSATVGLEDESGGITTVYSVDQLSLADRQSFLFTWNPVPETDNPVGAVAVRSAAPDRVVWEVRFNEIVLDLDAADFALSGSAAGAAISSVEGLGERYLVTVDGFTALGTVLLGLPGGACRDIPGNPNEAIGELMCVLPMEGEGAFDDMESGAGEWVPTTGVYHRVVSDFWQYGTPGLAWGPGAAYSGSACWGTVLDGPYPPLAAGWVEMPRVRVGSAPVLEFMAWYEIQPVQDMGCVEVNGGHGWVNVTPNGTFEGQSAGWEKIRIELDPAMFANREIRVRFRLASDDYGQLGGLYIDDVRVSSLRDPGVWVVSYVPDTGVPGSSVPLAFAAYNATTGSYADVCARVESASAGVTVPGADTVHYGAMAPGAIVAGAAPVTLAIGPLSELASPEARLFHSTACAAGPLQTEALGFTIVGVPDVLGTNLLTVGTVAGVTNWMGRKLAGDGSPTSALFQVVWAGPDGLVAPPSTNGAPTGDDRLLYSVGQPQAFGRFGEGAVPPNMGRFIKTFRHNLGEGSVVYARAWDAPSFAASVAYGDSPLRLLGAAAVQTVDFGAWGAVVPVIPARDSNGDSIPDGYAMALAMDPRAPIAPLAAAVTGLKSAGTAGSGMAQFSSPVRIALTSNRVYVADSYNHRITIWDRALGTALGSYGSLGTNAASLRFPYGLEVDPAAGRLLVADRDNNRIVKLVIDPVTGMLSLDRVLGVGVLSQPCGVACGAGGLIYVADTGNNRITVLASDGSLASVIGAGWLTGPRSVDVTDDGLVLLADSGSYRIACYDTAGTFLWESYGNEYGLPYGRPHDVRIGPAGKLFVLDRDGQRLRVLSKPVAAELPDLLGVYGSLGTGPIQVKWPEGVAPALDEPVAYVADTMNARVLKWAVTFDADGDGMGDLWEDVHGLNSSSPADALLDADGDHVANIGEYRLGTDPQDGSQPVIPGVLFALRPVTVRIAPSIPPTVVWDAIEGVVYHIQVRDDFTKAVWTDAATVVPDRDGEVRWTAKGEAKANRFYRVVAECP